MEEPGGLESMGLQRVGHDLNNFSSVTQLCPTLCDPMNRSTPGLPVHHQLPESTQTHVHLTQSQSCTRKRSWSLFDDLLPVWPTTAFWIPVKPLHLRVCSANQWAALKTARSAASIGQREGPNSSLWQRQTAGHKTNASKVEWIGLWSFALSTIFIQPLANQLPLLQAFWQLFPRKTLLQPAGGRKWFPRIHWILKHGF